ncbi:MAG: hypothetical protein Athens101428_230 [Candidatus Berkelbacteria bacterium Athens1014_28]|uniref:Uncharacterized protein n=1 Tax=Candidatus Berkelbacteria bacterium Athens1014_28 TaxID=2017145 RepID=A0A554LNZ8_9BACT|nr:MAG: hypothetical protein Athens101428_230 [Candidatus Berkelbacteria bacterium Athens1014_28]
MPKNFFTTEYLFSTLPPTNLRMFWLILAIFATFILLAILLSLFSKIHKPLKARFFNFFLTIGTCGLIASFFRYQSFSYVGSRFAMLLVIVFAALWYAKIVFYSIFQMPKELKVVNNEKKYKKYLPKRK